MTRSRTFVAWTLRWGKWLWAIAIVLAIPATWRTAQLYAHLRSELEELLPRSAPSVAALDELRARMPGLQYLGVVVEAGRMEDLPAAERLLDDLATRVRAYPRDMVKAVRTGDADERAFVEDRAPLYMDIVDLEAIRDRIEARRDYEVTKETGALLEDDAPPPPLDFDDIRKKYDARAGGAKRFDGSRFSSKKMRTSLLLIEVGQLDTGRERGGALLDRVKGDLAALRPESYAPGMRVGFTGDVAINVEETSALIADLSLSSVLVVVCVVGVIVVYYQWWKSIAVLLPPLLLATVYTFAIASLPPLRITELNSNTAFLGSIIVGNGINFGIVLLARYVEERRRGAAVADAMTVGVWAARTGTLSAALAAGASYAALMLTGFRGFRQFGVIGGIGMVLSWVLAFVLMPPLATWLDRAPVLPPRRWLLMPTLARFVKARKEWIVVVAAVMVVIAAWRVRGFGDAQIETDFSKLRRADTWERGEGYWGKRMDELLGTYVTPTVILADDEEQARAIGRAIGEAKREPSLDAMIASVRTLDDVVPVDQEKKIAIVAQIREDLTPRIRSELTDDQRDAVEKFVGRGALEPLTATDLPETFTVGMREKDGSLGRAVLVYPKPVRALWEGPPLARFVAKLREIAAMEPGRRPARVAGSLALSNDILESIRRDGVLASVAALAGVVAVVLALLRGRRSTLFVIGSLLLGVLWLAAAAMAFGIKINFANFIAYPITFGIGVDYAVNVASRWEQDGRRSMVDAVSTTGGAVTLCSMTTIIGYSSLLLAENRALFLFGLLAVLGEVACLTTAIIVLPAVVESLARRTRS